MPRILPPVFAFILATSVSSGAGMPKAGDLAILYSPTRTDRASLAPDGRHLAYTVHEGRQLRLVLVDVDRPSEKAAVIVGEDERSVLHSVSQVRRVRIDFLRWVTPSRLVYVVCVPTNSRLGDSEKLEEKEWVETQRQEVRVVDADGRNASVLADADKLGYGYSPPPYTYRIDDNRTDDKTVFPAPRIYERPPRVLGLMPDTSGALLVEAIGRKVTVVTEFNVTSNTTTTGIGTVPTQRYRVDVDTGDARVLPDAVDLNDASLHDRQGRIRLVKVAGKYRYYPVTGGAWTALDKLIQQEAGATPLSPASSYYRPRAFPLAFGYDPNLLYFASNVGRDTVGLYTVDFAAGRRGDFAVEVPNCDLAKPADELSEAALVFDRHYGLAGVRQPGQTPVARWFDADLARVQDELDVGFPGRTASILEWDTAKRRFLVLVAGSGDPGRYYVYQTGRPGLLMEFVRRVPELTTGALDLAEAKAADAEAREKLADMVMLPDIAELPSAITTNLTTRLQQKVDAQIGRNEAQRRYTEALAEMEPTAMGAGMAYQLDVTEPFAFDTPAGVHLTGCVTLPRQHRGTLPPLLVYCHDFPNEGRIGLEFNRDAEALANSGLMVLQVNYRGTPGFGLKHRDAVREAGFDRAPVEDIQSAVAWVAAHYRFDTKRVALTGQGMGGYVALRALQLYPKEFRCAATIDAPTDLASWVNEATSELPQLGVNDLGNFSIRGPSVVESQEQSAKNGIRDVSRWTPTLPEIANNDDESLEGALGNGNQGDGKIIATRGDALEFKRRRSFFDVGTEKLKAMSVLQHAELITRPVFLVQNRDSTLVHVFHAADLRKALQRLGRDVEYYETTSVSDNDDLDENKARIMVRIGAFIMDSLYRYRVDLGETKVVREN